VHATINLVMRKTPWEPAEPGLVQAPSLTAGIPELKYHRQQRSWTHAVAKEIDSQLRLQHFILTVFSAGYELEAHRALHADQFFIQADALLCRNPQVGIAVHEQQGLTQCFDPVHHVPRPPSFRSTTFLHDVIAYTVNACLFTPATGVDNRGKCSHRPDRRVARCSQQSYLPTLRKARQKKAACINFGLLPKPIQRLQYIINLLTGTIIITTARRPATHGGHQHRKTGALEVTCRRNQPG
jgi:hypothetical protein